MIFLCLFTIINFLNVLFAKKILMLRYKIQLLTYHRLLFNKIDMLIILDKYFHFKNKSENVDIPKILMKILRL